MHGKEIRLENERQGGDSDGGEIAEGRGKRLREEESWRKDEGEGRINGRIVVVLKEASKEGNEVKGGDGEEKEGSKERLLLAMVEGKRIEWWLWWC